MLSKAPLRQEVGGGAQHLRDPHKLCSVELWSPRDCFSGWVHPHPRGIRAAPPLSILLLEPALDFLWKKGSVAKIKYEKHFSDVSAYR